MRFLTYLLLIGSLAASSWAAWFFFGGSSEDDDPELTALKRTVAVLESRVEKNDNRAMIDLGWVLARPESRISDPKRGFELFRQAAKTGSPSAQFALGWAFEKGRGVQQSFNQAAKWYRVAASAGAHPGAQFALGELYFNGRGVVHDYAEAITYYAKSAARGHSVAQYLLGIMYKEGWGVKRDLVQSYQWLMLAAPNASRVKRHNGAFDPVRERDQVKRRLNRTQIKRAEELAKEVTSRLSRGGAR